MSFSYLSLILCRMVAEEVTGRDMHGIGGGVYLFRCQTGTIQIKHILNLGLNWMPVDN